MVGPRSPSNAADQAAQNVHAESSSLRCSTHAGSRSRRPSSPAQRSARARRGASGEEIAAFSAAPGSTLCRAHAVIPTRLRNGAAVLSSSLTVPLRVLRRQPTESGSQSLLRVRQGFDQGKQLVETGRLTGLDGTDRATNTSPVPGDSSAARPAALRIPPPPRRRRDARRVFHPADRDVAVLRGARTQDACACCVLPQHPRHAGKPQSEWVAAGRFARCYRS